MISQEIVDTYIRFEPVGGGYTIIQSPLDSTKHIIVDSIDDDLIREIIKELIDISNM